MTQYLGTLPAFSVNADVDVEFIDTAGQKLQLSSSGKIVMARPASYYAKRSGPFGSFELFIDGKTSTLYSQQRGAYFQVALLVRSRSPSMPCASRPGSSCRRRSPLRRCLFGLVTDVTSGAHFGTASSDGIECDHLAFRPPRSTGKSGSRPATSRCR